MDPLDPGTAVAGYSVVRLLQGGPGAGSVYEATGGGLDRPVALKVFAERLSQSAEFRERFRREAPRIAAVEHPSIARTYEAGSSAAGLYLALRLVKGRTLAELFGRGPLAPGATLELLGPVAEALDAAHSSGVLHRDLKPEKIIVSAPGRAFLTGFAMARPAADGGPRARSTPYLAPEQARGEPARRGAEIYSLAVLIYEALAGLPQSSPHDEAALAGFANGSLPSLMARRPELPEGVDEVLARALATDPRERPGSAGEMVADLRRALDVDRGGARSRPAAGADRAPVAPSATAVVSGHDLPRPAAPSVDERLEHRRARRLAARRRQTLRAVPLIVGATVVAAVAGWYTPSLLGQREAPTAPVRAVAPPAATSDAYEAALARAFERLNERRATLEARLGRARTASGQARAASALAQAHADAARALASEPQTQRERSTNAGIVTALREVATAYEAMGSSASRGDARAFASGAGRAARGEARVRRAVRGLTGLGYSVE